MDSACPKELATQILSDSDHSTKVAPTTLNTSNPLVSRRYREKISVIGGIDPFSVPEKD